MKGFRKVDPDQWEFASEGFLRGQKHLLKTIKRRKTSLHAPDHQQLAGPILEFGHLGLEAEVERLKHDKCILMTELLKLRQEQQSSGAHLKAMEDRLQLTEQRQQQMMAFLARAMRSPDFPLQLFQQKERRKELEEAISRKRRRSIEEGSDPADTGSSTLDTPQAPTNPTKTCVQRSHAMHDYDVPQFESLVLGVQREHEEGRTTGGDLNDEFWEELLNESNGDAGSISDVHDDDDDKDANLLVRTMGYLGPAAPK